MGSYPPPPPFLWEGASHISLGFVFLCLKYNLSSTCWANRTKRHKVLRGGRFQYQLERISFKFNWFSPMYNLYQIFILLCIYSQSSKTATINICKKTVKVNHLSSQYGGKPVDELGGKYLDERHASNPCVTLLKWWVIMIENLRNTTFFA